MAIAILKKYIYIFPRQRGFQIHTDEAGIQTMTR
jgi:hypothetical protein